MRITTAPYLMIAVAVLAGAAGCRKDPASVPPPAKPSTAKSGAPATLPPAAAGRTTSAPSPAKTVTSATNPPAAAPAIVSIPVDGPDIFLKDKRPVVDYAQSFQQAAAEARQGSARGQARLGLHYWNAHGTERNPAAAVEWLRKAAEQGDAEGQYYLGHAYEEGFGVARDEAEAVKWKRKALEQGYQPVLRSGGSYVGGKGQ